MAETIEQEEAVKTDKAVSLDEVVPASGDVEVDYSKTHWEELEQKRAKRSQVNLESEFKQNNQQIILQALGDSDFSRGSLTILTDGELGRNLDVLRVLDVSLLSSSLLESPRNFESISEQISRINQSRVLPTPFVREDLGEFEVPDLREIILGTGLNDTLTASPEGSRLFGLESNDTLVGDIGNDILNGGEGNDQLIGGEGDDILNGGNGLDFADYADATSSVNVDLNIQGVAQDTLGGGMDTLIDIERVTGSNFDDVLIGDAGNNVLTGLDGDDQLIGGEGNDSLRGGEGNDILNGGDGFDTADYVDATSGVSVDLNIQGVAQDTLGAGMDTLIDIERVTGSDFDDILIGNTERNELFGGDGNDVLIGGDGNDDLRGGGGDDILDGGDGLDRVEYTDATASVVIDLNIQGVAQDTLGAGIDTLIDIERITGSVFDDVLIGDAGNNTLRGEEGNDQLIGGEGNDQLLGGEGNDILNGGNGLFDTANYVDATSGVNVDLNIQGIAQDTLGGGMDTLIDIESVIGSQFDDVLIGDAANNVLTGRDGDDQLIGGGGNDNLRGGLGDDILNGGDGLFDVANYIDATSGVSVDLNIQGVAQDTLGGGMDTLIDIELITGSNFDDVLIGDAGNNILRGEEGNDQLIGGAGNDTLYGESGTDNLTGGAGADRFLFEAINAFNGIDQINDFNVGEGDIIDISDIVTGYDASVDDINDFVRFVDSGANTTLEIDSDGLAGGASFQAVTTISGGAGLDATTLEANGNLDTVV